MASKAVNRVTNPERRPLDVSCLGTLTMRWLIPNLFGFQAAFPSVDVRLTSDDGPVDFGRQRIDVAIRVGKASWPDDASITPLFEDAVGPVLSPRLLPADGLASWEGLISLPLLHTRTRPDAWANWCREARASLPLAGRQFDHFYFMLEAATAGLGVAIAPEVLVRDDLKAGRLVAPFGFRPSGRTYVALTPRRQNADMAAFVTWLKDEAARMNTATTDAAP